jgi:hypothetical protein
MALLDEHRITVDSHQFLDRLALAYHHAIAERLLASPEEVLGVARDNLLRWIQRHAGTGTVQALKEWQDLIETRTVAELAAIMTDDSDEGQRLRQSTPFAGVLSDDERREVFDRCEEGILV